MLQNCLEDDMCLYRPNAQWEGEFEKLKIDFKIILLTYKALNGLAPLYLTELLSSAIIWLSVCF